MSYLDNRFADLAPVPDFMTPVPAIGKNEAARAKTVPALYNQLQYFALVMQRAGFPLAKDSPILTLALAQMALETDWFTSTVAEKDNNYSGIKYLGKSYQNATQGIKSPEGNYYAHFADFAAWVKDYIRVLSLNMGGKGRPIDSRNAGEFLDRLKANGYFQASNYATAYMQVLKKVNDTLQWGNSQDAKVLEAHKKGQTTYTYEAGKGVVDNTNFDIDRWLNTRLQWAKDNPVPAAGIAALAVLALRKLLQ